MMFRYLSIALKVSRAPTLTLTPTLSISSLSPPHAFYSTKLGRSKHITPPLRDYQLECINECLITIQKGYRRFAVSMPTGSGKTRTFYGLLGAIAEGEEAELNHDGSMKKWLILAHREELILQAYEHAKKLFPHRKVGIEMGKHKVSPDTEIVIASVQSISRDGRLERFHGRDISAIVIDEAHHAPAASYAKILNHLGALEPDSKIVVAGFSATLSRMDGLALGSTFDYIAYHKDLSEMIRNGYLTDIKFTTISTEVDLTDVKQSRGDFVTKSLSKVVDSPALNQLVYKAWKRQSGKHTLIFGVNIQHVGNLAKVFRDNGVDAHVVTSNTPNDLRHTLISDFKSGKIPVLINCGIFTEGTDIPNIDTVMLVRPTRSSGLLMQMIGRGLRLHPGKHQCHIIDMFGSSSDANGLATVPTLAGLDPKDIEVVDKSIFTSESNPRKKSVAKPDNPDQVFVEEFDNLEEFLNRDGSKLNTSAINRSLLNWIPSGQNNFLLFSKDGYLRLCPDHTLPKAHSNSLGFSLIQYFKNPFKDDEVKSSKTPGKHYSKFLRKDIFTNVPYFNSALNAADLFARQNCAYHLIAKNIAWRDQPRTVSQEKAVLKMFQKVIPSDDSEAISRAHKLARNLTKGQSANLINLASIGNKSTFKDMIYIKQDKRKREIKPSFSFLQSGPIDVQLENKVSSQNS